MSGQSPLRAISIRQPMAWAVFHGKDIENRSTKYQHQGLTLIHAAQKFDREMWYWLRRNAHLLDAPLPQENQFRYGGIIGVVNIVGRVITSTSPFFFGPFGYLLEGQTEIPFVPCQGRLGFPFTPEADVVLPDRCVKTQPTQLTLF